MKNYRQLLKELPSKKVVFAFGRFQPPTTGHELLVKAVQKIALTQKADHIIFASKTEDKKTNPLPVDRKVYYLKRMFPGANFRAADNTTRTMIEAAKFLNKKYKNLVMVAGSDRVAAFTKFLNDYNGKEYNYDTITVVSAGERDPDSDTATGMSGTKMREAAKAGKFKEFKRGVPKTLTDLDARRLMNEIRKAYSMEAVKESLNIEIDDLREKYFRGEIFNIGDRVVCEETVYIVVKRGTNHLLLQQEGIDEKVTRWIKDVSPLEENEYMDVSEAITNKTLKPTSLDQLKAARIIAATLGVDNVESTTNSKQLMNLGLRKIRNKALNPESFKILQRMLKMANDIGIQYDASLLPQKLKEQYNGKLLKYNEFGQLEAEIEISNVDTNAQSADDKVNSSDHHRGIPHKADINTVGSALSGKSNNLMMRPYETDNDNVRHRRIRYHLGEQSSDQKSMARKVAQSALAAKHAREKEAVAKKHEQERDRISEDTDESYIIPAGQSTEKKSTRNSSGMVKVGNDKGPGNRQQLGRDRFAEEIEDYELSDSEIDEMVDLINDLEDMIDAYDDDELALIDMETGEELDEEIQESQQIMEVLSRMERIKSRIRFARTKAKRQVKARMALKRSSTQSTINRRARKLAVKTLKQRLVRKPLNKLSVSEKERLEQRMKKMKPAINRIAMKMAPKVRQVEKKRLSHSTFTKK